MTEKSTNIIWQYFKPFARGLIGIATILAGCFTAGWGGAWGLQKIFDTQLARAEFRMEQKIINSESKVLALHSAGISKIEGKLDVLIELNKGLLSLKTEEKQQQEDVR